MKIKAKRSKERDRLELAKAMRRRPDIKVILEMRKAQDIKGFLVNLGKHTHEYH